MDAPALKRPKKELGKRPVWLNRTLLAKRLGVSRASLYYSSTKDEKDWALKTRIEHVLREHPSYGSRCVALELSRNRKGVQRVMRRFGIKPYRRLGRKWPKKRAIPVVFPNLLRDTIPARPHHIWVADFTELFCHEKKVYLATVIDLYTREVVGIAASVRKGTVLTPQALCAALQHFPHPAIFHSDNGREYEAQAFVALLTKLGIHISRSHPGCPWENGYQESFYGKFKLDLGDPNRFETLGELVAEIYRVIWAYNTTRIHSALKMPPRTFVQQLRENRLERVRLTV